MKKLLVAFAALGAIVSAGSASHAAAGDIGITVMGQPLQTDSAPVAEKGRVLLPFRAVAEALGADVAWDQNTRTVTVDKWTQHMSLTLGQQVAVIEYEDGNGTSKQTVALDVPVRAIHNRIYVPIRFVSENFGYRVSWADGKVSIESPMDDRERAELYSGDLAAARKIAINLATFAGVHYEHPVLQTLHSNMNYNNEYLFPQGEALRFFHIDGSETATLIEVKNDLLVATWQAHLDPNKGDSPGQLAGGELKDLTGPKPDIGGPFLYYEAGFSGPSQWVGSGIVGTDGKLDETGIRNYSGGVLMSEGPISLKLPNEIRNESVKIPEPFNGASLPPVVKTDDFALSYKGSWIRLGDWDYDVNLDDILGLPQGWKVDMLQADTHTGSYLKTAQYEGLKMELFSPKGNGRNFWIMTMEADGEGYATSKGIEVGAAAADMKKAYPGIAIAPDGRTDPDNCAYIMANDKAYNYLKFEVKDGIVREIDIYHTIP